MFGKNFDSKQNSFEEDLKSFLKERTVFNSDVKLVVQEVIELIRTKGDRGVIEATNKFDNRNISTIDELVISIDDAEKISRRVDKEVLDALEFSYKRILSFHENLYSEFSNRTTATSSNNGIKKVYRPLEDVLMYVPGGKASYPSTVLMAAGPAQASGVKRLSLTTPCPSGHKNHLTLAAARVAGIEKIYSIGGIQAIAAFSLGTESIERVQKVIGPGNQYVAEAKRQLYGEVGIDSIAGPSEIVIVTDVESDPVLVAWDLMAQAEHDEQATSILISSSKEFIFKVKTIIEEELKNLPRAEIINTSLKNKGACIFVDSSNQAVDIVNMIAPEHLHMVTKNATEDAKNISRAGLILVGKDSANSLSDYVLGPSHILPTKGSASFSSPLSVEDFIVSSSYIEIKASDNNELYEDILDATFILAEAEGLNAHARAAQIRKKES